MFAVYADHMLLASSDTDSPIILGPNLHLKLNQPGRFTFTLPPQHPCREQIEKLKTVIRVEMDGRELFHGRVTEEETDVFCQKKLECESELALLRDSLQPPFQFEGSPLAFLCMLIHQHNAAVSPEQQFQLGRVTAVTDSGQIQAESAQYADTLSVLSSRLLSSYGGFLFVRYENGSRILDYLSQPPQTAQPISFGVNLIELHQSQNAEKLFNVLIPLGAPQRAGNGQPLTISSVNGGQDYIEDTASISRVGRRIWSVRQWDWVDDPQTLLAKGREYLAAGISQDALLTVSALDMHFASAEVQPISLGDRVHILSQPHGMDLTEVCMGIQLDLFHPEKAVYTFGKPRQALTDDLLALHQRTGGGRGRRSLEEQIQDVERWARLILDQQEGRIDLTAGEINRLTSRMHTAEIAIDGVNASISLAAENLDLLGERLSSAEINIDGLEGEITLKVSKNGVISCINQTAEEVKIQARKIDLSGYVTASQLSATNAAISNLVNGMTTAVVVKSVLFSGGNFNGGTVTADFVNAAGMRHGGKLIQRRTLTVSTPSGSETIYYLGYAP